MRIAIVLILIGSLLSVAPTASACSHSGSIGPDLEETWASLNDDEDEYVDCTTNVAKGEVDRYTIGAVKFAKDAAGLVKPLDTVHSMSCNVIRNGERMCLW